MGDSTAALGQQEQAAELAPGTTSHARWARQAKLLGLGPAEATGAEAFALARGLPDPEERRVVGAAVVDGSHREEALAIVDRAEGLPELERQELRLAPGDGGGTINRPSSDSGSSLEPLWIQRGTSQAEVPPDEEKSG